MLKNDFLENGSDNFAIIVNLNGTNGCLSNWRASIFWKTGSESRVLGRFVLNGAEK